MGSKAPQQPPGEGSTKPPPPPPPPKKSAVLPFRYIPDATVLFSSPETPDAPKPDKLAQLRQKVENCRSEWEQLRDDKKSSAAFDVAFHKRAGIVEGFSRVLFMIDNFDNLAAESGQSDQPAK